MECLSNRVQELSENCKHEILRIAELQADDYHLDRPLFYACREDRERLCKRTRAGSGKVYKCLMRHKFDRDMSSEVTFYASPPCILYFLLDYSFFFTLKESNFWGNWHSPNSLTCWAI